MPNGSRAKRWCLTLNNFGANEVLTWRRAGRSEAVSYLVFGREGRPLGTPHLQGYVEFSTRKRLNQVKALFGRRIHAEKSRGSPEAASSYCKKEGDYEEYGTRSSDGPGSGRGARTDLEGIRNEIAAGVPEEEIATRHFAQWCIHRKAFREYKALISKTRDFKSEVYVLWGDTGTGKTLSVVESEPDLWIAPDNQLNWFDGYVGQEAVLFDDFVGCKNVKFGFLLRLLDRYAMQVPVKGGFVNWVPKRIYITSNIDPTNWFLGVSNQSQAALRRRFTGVTHFSNLEEDDSN